MSDNEAFYSGIAPVAIEHGTGLLGADTNGAMPAAATAILMESEIGIYQNEILENYWIKVCISPERSARDSEHLMYASDFATVERVLSAIVAVAVRGEAAGKLAGTYDAYRNSAQTLHDEEASEECHEGLDCTVRAGARGAFEVVFTGTGNNRSGAGRGEAVARLGGVMSPASALDLQKAFETFRAARDQAVRNFQRQLDQAADEAPSPSM